MILRACQGMIRKHVRHCGMMIMAMMLQAAASDFTIGRVLQLCRYQLSSFWVLSCVPPITHSAPSSELRMLPTEPHTHNHGGHQVTLCVFSIKMLELPGLV